MGHGHSRRSASRARAFWRAAGPVRWLLAALIACAGALALAAAPGLWQKIGADDVHDPHSPAVGVLQEPTEALQALPRDTVGARVRWVDALDRGLIQPRTNILPETKVNLRTTEVLLRNTGEMPMVRFPHRQHTLWLDCSNCHDELFARAAGTTRINMLLILSGEKCGLCHGAVAFPLTECKRCHSVERGSPEHQAFGKGLVRDANVP
ncbi:hypothetical protein GCM10028796_50890 [Ramlibacter monticola]|uniref:Cytochrome c7-like domain-containing protein n=1 Tax=Ramlibacter monticola TaxID=1926872 RepID=A0A936YZ14_9BURK|nr:c(7)-type cytochrome triheme domain-containing protein [Ramlibacter monticola]MBL0390746.1 hypothetical protein [Ramlibacter monticola]